MQLEDTSVHGRSGAIETRRDADVDRRAAPIEQQSIATVHAALDAGDHVHRTPRTPTTSRPTRNPAATSDRSRRRADGGGSGVLGGADGAVLEHVPTETPRFVQMFFVLAGTALVSAISMDFALTTGVRSSPRARAARDRLGAHHLQPGPRSSPRRCASRTVVGRLIGSRDPPRDHGAVIGIVVAEPLVLQIVPQRHRPRGDCDEPRQAQSDQDAVTAGLRSGLWMPRASASRHWRPGRHGVVAGADRPRPRRHPAQQTVDDLTAKLAASSR